MEESKELQKLIWIHASIHLYNCLHRDSTYLLIFPLVNKLCPYYQKWQNSYLF